MNMPSELQAILDNRGSDHQIIIDDDTPSTDKNDAPEDDWLSKMMGGENDDKPSADDKVDTSDDGDDIDIDNLFKDDDDEPFVIPDVDDDDGKDSDEISELKEMLAGLEDKLLDNQQQKDFDEKVNSALAKLKDKYGEADSEVIETFKDMFNAFRSSVGSELESEIIKSNMELHKEIDTLKAQLKDVSKKPTVEPDSKKENVNEYRDLIAETIPNYGKILASPKFKALMKTPIDKDNPSFTFDKKLGRLYKGRKTADIVKFFTAFDKKYISKGESRGAVVDSGISSADSVKSTSKGLDPDRLRSVLKRVMAGELKLSAEQMQQVRQHAAKLQMSAQ